jgi:hypothetical protein
MLYLFITLIAYLNLAGQPPLIQDYGEKAWLGWSWSSWYTLPGPVDDMMVALFKDALADKIMMGNSAKNGHNFYS